MTALSTHDTKRSEDVRARITVLAEVPDVWAAALDRLLDAGAAARPRLRRPALAGGRRRLADRAASGCTRTPRRRCARPASTPPGPTPTRTYEARRARRRRRGVRRRRGTRGRRRPASPRSTRPAAATRLAAKLLALTMPGVPDVYQGTELWDLSLVDPDNRRPVDFDAAESRCSPTAATRRSSRVTATRPAAAARPARAVHVVRRRARRRPGRRPRARLRPRRRDHRRDPAAGRPRRARAAGATPCSRWPGPGATR